MDIITLGQDRFVAVDGDNATVLKKAELQVELERANYNIQELEKMIIEAESKVVSTTKLGTKQVEAIKQFNDLLGIEGYRRELDQFKKDKTYLESILK